MRRWLALVLLCFLPLQVSWAAVTDYCSHEQGPAAQHLGHHDDEHQAWSGPSDGQEQPGKPGFGHDCKHLSGFVGLLSGLAVTSHPASQASQADDERVAYPTPPQYRPERPQWPRPA
jgi:hypothetical protein